MFSFGLKEDFYFLPDKHHPTCYLKSEHALTVSFPSHEWQLDGFTLMLTTCSKALTDAFNPVQNIKVSLETRF